MTTLDGLRVCFDVLGAQELAWDRGIPRYIAEHASALGRADAGLDLVFRADPHRPLMPPTQSLAGSGRLRRTRRDPWATQEGVRKLLHISSPFELSLTDADVWPAWSRSRDWTTVATVWDLVPLLFPDLYLSHDGLRRQYLQRVQLLAGVDHLVAISQCTAEDAQRHLRVADERITVIDAGVDHGRFAPVEGARPRDTVRSALPAIRDRYLFYVGGDDPRKNMPGLLRSFARSRARADGCQLVVTCALRPDRITELLAIAADAGALPDDVVLTGHVPDPVLIALYQACTLFVFPSLYEGSGLPMLEAMAAGAPLIAASTSTGPEIVGAPDAMFDPREERDITRAIDETLEEPGRLETLRARSRTRAAAYTWEHVAAQTLEAYDRAVTRAASRRHPLRPGARPLSPAPSRLAVVSPLPPSPTGIGDYVARLIPELRRHSALPIDLVIADDAPVPVGIDGVLRETAFRSRVMLSETYRGALFQLGNSGFHTHMADLLPWTAAHGVPATAMFHEAIVSGLYADGVRDHRMSARVAAESVRAAYPYLPYKPPEELLDFLVHGGPTHGVLMTAALQAPTEAVLVHSVLARELLLADRGDGDGPPVGLLDLAAPVPPDAEGKRDADLVVSTGGVAAIKGIDALIEGFALAQAVRPELRLVVAGGFGRDEEMKRFHSAIENLDLRHAVSMPGFLDAGERWALLARAGVVVQLRRRTYGEASAAVMDALATGAPTIVSDAGWMADLPRGVVERVPAECGGETLGALLLELRGDERRRSSLSTAALRHAAGVRLADVASRLLSAWPAASAGV